MHLDNAKPQRVTAQINKPSVSQLNGEAVKFIRNVVLLIKRESKPLEAHQLLAVFLRDLSHRK